MTPQPQYASSAEVNQPPVNGRWSGFVHLLAARLKEMAREPEVIFWIFIFPLLLALGLGIAFRQKPQEAIPVAIVQGPGAQRALDLLENSSLAHAVRPQILPSGAANRGFRFGRFALVIAPSGSGFEFQYDPARQESAEARIEINDALQRAAGRADPVPVQAVVSNQPGARYIDFLIPGLVGMNLMGSGMWGIGFGLVEMRQRKLLKRFVATPMRRSDFLLALAGSRLALMVVELGMLVAFGALVFKMPIEGNIAVILLVATIGAMTFAGLGLLTASRARKIESASGLVNLVMMPMWVFSGVFFSYERFPAALIPVIRLLPLTALNDALRSTILEGAPISAQGARLAVLAVWGGVSFFLALRWFRWT
jgi:ABC-2 type transport system permease protein